MTQPIADWYDDPNAPQQLRYWDGQQWTEHVAPKVAAPVAVTVNNFASPAAAYSTLNLPVGVNTASPWMRLASALLDLVLKIVTLGIGWLIWGAIIGSNGQTPAKRILGLRVVDGTTFRPVGLAKMFWVRGVLCQFIVGPAFFFTLYILAFMPFWDKNNQNIWDKISDTYVVCDPQDAWNTKPALA